MGEKINIQCNKCNILYFISRIKIGGVNIMKDYNIILSTVERSLKHHSIDYTTGYIYALLDWCVISLETFERLEDFIKKEVL